MNSKRLPRNDNLYLENRKKSYGGIFDEYGTKSMTFIEFLIKKFAYKDWYVGRRIIVVQNPKNCSSTKQSFSGEHSFSNVSLRSDNVVCWLFAPPEGIPNRQHHDSQRKQLTYLWFSSNFDVVFSVSARYRSTISKLVSWFACQTHKSTSCCPLWCVSWM